MATNDSTQVLDDLEVAVTEDETVDGSAILLLNGLAAALEAAAVDPTRVRALADRVRTTSAALAAAISANTPAAEEPVS